MFDLNLIDIVQLKSLSRETFSKTCDFLLVKHVISCFAERLHFTFWRAKRLNLISRSSLMTIPPLRQRLILVDLLDHDWLDDWLNDHRITD